MTDPCASDAVGAADDERPASLLSSVSHTGPPVLDSSDYATLVTFAAIN